MSNLPENQRHYLWGTKAYKAWGTMLQRCTNENLPNYKDYGGRGISVCEEWKDFKTFIADMDPSPEGTRLDRIDNDGNYTKSNCRWATYSESAQNTRARKQNQTGVKGVSSFGDGRCSARVYEDGVRRTLYRGTSLAEAILARIIWDMENSDNRIMGVI